MCGLTFLGSKTNVKAVRALLLALALFAARDVQALDRGCATLSTEQLIACLQDCPDAQRGVACRRSCIHEHNKAQSCLQVAALPCARSVRKIKARISR